MSALKRDVGLWSATAIGVEAIIGAGIFVVTGLAAGVAGPALVGDCSSCNRHHCLG